MINTLQEDGEKTHCRRAAQPEQMDASMKLSECAG